jgi:hypothetical protein
MTILLYTQNFIIFKKALCSDNSDPAPPASQPPFYFLLLWICQLALLRWKFVQETFYPPPEILCGQQCA